MTNTNNNKIGISKNGIPFALNLKYLNRHGYIGGATGSGKTTTLKKMVEVLHDNNINTFMIDVKKDLQAIGNHETISLLDFYGSNGIKIDISINDLGIDHLSNIIDLTQAQKEALKICLLYARNQGFTIETIKELYDTLDTIYQMLEAEDESFNRYGYISKQSLKTIMRKVLILELDNIYKAFDITTFKPVEVIDNPITILDASELFKTPKLYSAIVNYMLRNLLFELPEVGDREKPKAVLFLDEAHLIFNHANKTIINDITETIKLLRSKGIGVIFISQLVTDIPREIYSQLTLKIQHAININTEEDFRKLKSTSRAFSNQDNQKETEETILNLKIGQALILQKTDNGINQKDVIQVDQPSIFTSDTLDDDIREIFISEIDGYKPSITEATDEPYTSPINDNNIKLSYNTKENIKPYDKPKNSLEDNVKLFIFILWIVFALYVLI